MLDQLYANEYVYPTSSSVRRRQDTDTDSSNPSSTSTTNEGVQNDQESVTSSTRNDGGNTISDLEYEYNGYELPPAPPPTSLWGDVTLPRLLTLPYFSIPFRSAANRDDGEYFFLA